MKQAAVVLLAAVMEAVILTELTVFGLVLPVFLLALILVSRRSNQLLLIACALLGGVLFDTFRAGGMTIAWLITTAAVAGLIIAWRSVLREQISSPRYLVQVYTPLVLGLAFLWAFLPYIATIDRISWPLVFYEWAMFSVSLALGLLVVRLLERRYGVS